MIILQNKEKKKKAFLKNIQILSKVYLQKTNKQVSISQMFKNNQFYNKMIKINLVSLAIFKIKSKIVYSIIINIIIILVKLGFFNKVKKWMNYIYIKIKKHIFQSLVQIKMYTQIKRIIYNINGISFKN